MRPKVLSFRVLSNVIPVAATNALTTTNTYYDGISGGAAKSNMSVNAVPSKFKEANTLNIGSNVTNVTTLASGYFMYSFNNGTAQQRTRVATVSFRFTDENTAARDITMNIPSMVPIRIGISSTIFSTPMLSGCTLLSATPAVGTLRDYFQEVSIL